MDAEIKLHFPSVTFVKSATKPNQYPESVLPEVAVVGSSNVGKSSLMNSLFNHRKMVQVSRTPGRTRLINFFDVDKKLMMVDLPGYGYAKVSASMKKQWQPMIETYLTERPHLMACLLLLDIRRNPSRDDLDIWRWLRSFDMTVMPILTKCDKMSKQQGSNQRRKIAMALDVPQSALIMTSSKNHQGREQLRTALSGFCWQTPVLEEELSDEDSSEETTTSEE